MRKPQPLPPPVAAPAPLPVAVRAPAPVTLAPPRPRTVSLTNRVKGTRSFNLTHEAMCAKGCVCKAVVASVVKSGTSTRQPGLHSRTITCPEPLTLLAGETRRGLPESILGSPEITKAVADRRLSVTKE